MTKPGGEIPQDAVERAREVSNAWLGDHMADRIELETAIAAALHAYAEERVRAYKKELRERSVKSAHQYAGAILRDEMDKWDAEQRARGEGEK